MDVVCEILGFATLLSSPSRSPVVYGAIGFVLPSTNWLPGVIHSENYRFDLSLTVVDSPFQRQ